MYTLTSLYNITNTVNPHILPYRYRNGINISRNGNKGNIIDWCESGYGLKDEEHKRTEYLIFWMLNMEML